MALHVDDREQCVLVSPADAATRSAFYRRERPDGTETDDIEASLAIAEGHAAPVLRATLAERRLTTERKSGLAQLLGLQLLRGPLHFKQRSDLLERLLSGPPDTVFKKGALRRAGGDADAVRAELLAAYSHSSFAYVSMLEQSLWLATVLGHMSWHLLEFDEPLLLYGDHPVVVWPSDRPEAEPFDRPHQGPLGAWEVRVPLAPDLALLLNWDAEGSRERPVRAGTTIAAELNAFGRSQAERQWMHRPGAEPPIASGRCRPASRLLNRAYDLDTILRAPRRARAASAVAALRRKQPPSSIEVIDDLP